MAGLEDLYREIILDHYRSPRNRGDLPTPPAVRAEGFNLFNRSNFVRVNATYGNGVNPLPTFLAPLAGISNADPGRQFQFATRFTF